MKISLYLSIFALSLLTSCALFTPVSDSSSAPSSVKGEGKQRQVAVDMAVSLKGTKYKKAGSKPSTGFDCSGFTSYVLNRSGVEVPRTSRDQESAAQLKKLSHLN